MRVSLKTFLTTLVMAQMLTIGCQTTKQEELYEPIEPQLEAGSRLTPELIWQMGRVGNPQVSPDGNTMVFTIAYTDVKSNKSFTDIYTMPVAGGEMKRITRTVRNEYEVAWRPDGQAICYLASAGEAGSQVFEIGADGSGIPRQITNVKGGVDGFIYSPDMKHILYLNRVKLDRDIHDMHPDMPLATARIETSLMYRHWNEWSDGSYNHLFVADLSKDGVAAEDAKDILEGEPYHSPLMPFDGMEDVCWTPDSKSVIYTCKKLTGLESAKSTNSNLYQYNLEDGQTVCLTDFNKGYDKNPLVSADGKNLFWLSMEHDGYESDQNRIIMMDLQTRQEVNLMEKSDLSVSSFCLDSESDAVVWAIIDENAKEAIFRIDVATKQLTRITDDVCDYTSVISTPQRLVTTRQSMHSPTEIYGVDKESGEATSLTTVNASILNKLDLGRVEERWVKTTDGKKELVWVLYPPHFDQNKRYPALLYCQGGPQNTVSQFWSSRWNLALMAANDYIVVAPNRRGLPGFGREWNEQISGDYGGQNMKDYLSAIDSVKEEPFVDEERLGAVGASYGGFSIYWLAGHHEGRFKAFISHCGIFNFDQMYATTEEVFFTDWDLKGAFWERDNAVAMKSYAESPHLFVGKWDTPIMVIHGEKDFRIPYTQGMAAFNSAVMRGIPAEFLYFPDECHWVQKPQNSIVWHREFYKWLDRWLKTDVNNK
ncbi:MAG: S9 family peptidase [Marinilabiliaceae bacterium]|nr:S9 family peptidase [Marinilabiliaceae bacterium]